MDNYYNILNIEKTASSEEIKKSFRKLSLKHHPDKGGNKEMFSKINEAYQTLNCPKKRSDYDILFESTFNPTSKQFKQYSDEKITEDIKNMFFTMFSNKEDVLSKPVPIIKTIEITLEQSFNGTVMPLLIERWVKDNSNTKYVESETIYVDINKGIDNNELIIIREKGNIINENNKGDIKIFIKVNEHPEFIRKGLDLYYTHSLTLKEALCGFSFTLNYFNGRSFNITNHDTIINNGNSKVIQNLGMSRSGKKGNLIIQFNVTFPESLTTEQKMALSKIL